MCLKEVLYGCNLMQKCIGFVCRLQQLLSVCLKGCSMMKTAVIILAAGLGKRMQAGCNKMFLTIQGKTVLEHTVQAFQNSDAVDGIVIVVREAELAQVQQMVPQKVYPKIIDYAGGGKERQDSVYCGLQVLPREYERVLIHDGARPMVTQDLILRLLQPLSPSCGTVAGVPAKDTVKRVDKDGMVVETLERSQLWNIQTPQCFYTDTIRRCHQQAQQEGYYGTDDASLAERYGVSVQIVQGYYENIKLTTPEDLAVAELFLQRIQNSERGGEDK